LKTVCFTGHRPDKLGGYDETNPIAEYVKAQLRITIWNTIQDGYRRFIFGGALGVDTWAGEVVADMRDNTYHGDDIDGHYYPRISLELYSPFEGQEKMWPEESKIRYYSLMARCNGIVEVSEPGYKGWKMIVRDKAMVDASDLVIAVWNGDLGKSGTGHTVAYAQKKNKPIIIIDPREVSDK
jgi:uncharacterized phage-like protein YoqJ